MDLFEKWNGFVTEMEYAPHDAVNDIVGLLKNGKEVPDELIEIVKRDPDDAWSASIAFMRYLGYVPEGLPSVYGRRGEQP